MFDTVFATRFVRPMEAGRTNPKLIECERDDGDVVEAIVKCSSKTMQGTKDLAIEAICGMLAQDLGLPIPEFFAVNVTDEFIEIVDDEAQRNMFRDSDRVAFGSRAVDGGFSVWGVNQKVPEALCEVAAEIFTFDAIVINGDRRPENPNCLFSGSKFAIIDHELCFAHELFWRAPWEQGGFDTRSAPEKHIFAKPRMERCPGALPRFVAAWDGLTPERFDEYFEALPPSWVLPEQDETRIKQLMLDAKTHVRDIVQYSLGALR